MKRKQLVSLVEAQAGTSGEPPDPAPGVATISGESQFTFLLESPSVELLAPGDATGSVWDVVIIEVGFSKNRGQDGLPRYYPESCIRRAVNKGIFEGMPAKTFRFADPVNGGKDEFNHLSKEGRRTGRDFAENVIGFYEQVTFGEFKRPDGSTGQGAIAKLHVLEGAKALRENMVDAFKKKRYDLYGLSIDAGGTAHVGVAEGRRAEIVEDILQASSSDIVSEPAAGGSLLRLVASREREDSMNWEELLKLIESSQPSMLKGLPAKAPEQDPADYVKHITEANLERSKKRFLEADGDEATLEAAGEMKVMERLLSLLQAGKIEDAVELIKSNMAPPAPPAENDEAMKEGETTETPDSTPAKVEIEVSVAGTEQAKEDIAGVVAASQAATATGTEAAAVMSEAQKILAEAKQMKVDAGISLQEIRDMKKDIEKDHTKGLVESVVKASGLPENAQNKLVKELGHKIGITESIIKERIATEREYIASFVESGRPRGLGDAHSFPTGSVVTVEKSEKLAKAMQGMFSGEDVDGIPAFMSLTESWGAYGLPFGTPELTAELMFKNMVASMPAKIAPRQWEHRGNPLARHQQRLRESWGSQVPVELRESVTTADWAVAFGDSMFRELQKAYTDDPLNDWRQVSRIMSLTDWTNKVKIIRHGAVDNLPIVNEQGAYQELQPPTPTEEYEELDPNKHGGLRKFTMEDVMADRLDVLRRIPRDLARSAVRTIHEAVWDQFETNPIIQGNALLSVANNNLVATSPALTYGAVTDAVRLLREQTELGSGRRLGLRPKWLIVGTKKENEAIEITDSEVKQTNTEDATITNVVRRWGVQAFPTLGVGRSAGTENHWWVVTDKSDCDLVAVGFPGGRDRPDIFVQGQGQETQGSVFDADAITWKIRLVFGVKLVDFRGIAGSLATT